MPETVSQRLLDRVASAFTTFREYFGIGGKVRREPIEHPEALRAYLSSRASFIAQTSLYGYLRTRAGQRYPQLFDNDEFVVSINIAKWHLWLASLSDITVYAGGLMAQRSTLSDERVGEMMLELLDAILAETGVPDEADAEFPEHRERVRARITLTAWHAVEDGEACFQESPDGLVRWAPVIKDFMDQDEEIVRSSVRYHWQEIRRELRQYLVAEAVAAAVDRGDHPGPTTS